MARKKKNHNGKKMTLPLAVIAGLAPGVSTVVRTGMDNGWESGARTAAYIYTGYDQLQGKWAFSNMRLGLMPLGLGVLVHKIAGKLGINRAIAAAGIPIIRI